MTSEERRLYHQIHPVKLFTDFSTAFVSTYLFWRHMLFPAIALAIVPSILVSVFLIQTVDLEKYRDSAFGRYVKEFMNSRIIDTFRFGGFFLIVFGGWYQTVWLIVFGFITIAVCWTYGLLLRRGQRTA